MEKAENQKQFWQIVTLSAGVAIVVALACVLAQYLIFGKVNSAVTGGVVGGATAAIVLPRAIKSQKTNRQENDAE